MSNGVAFVAGIIIGAIGGAISAALYVFHQFFKDWE